MEKQSVRERILTTASRLFYQNGYNRTGINEIIREANIAKASLYAHFPSKEAICLAYLNQLDRQLTKNLKAHTAGVPAGQERLLSLFSFLDEFYHQDDFNGCWCINTIAEIPHDNVVIRTEIHRQKQSLMRFIEGLVKENTTGLDDEAIVTLSQRLYLLYEGAIAESHLQNDHWPIKAAAETAALLLE